MTAPAVAPLVERPDAAPSPNPRGRWRRPDRFAHPGRWARAGHHHVVVQPARLHPADRDPGSRHPPVAGRRTGDALTESRRPAAALYG